MTENFLMIYNIILIMMICRAEILEVIISVQTQKVCALGNLTSDQP